MSRYESIIKNMLPLIGENKMVSAVTTEDLLVCREGFDGLSGNEGRIIADSRDWKAGNRPQ